MMNSRVVTVAVLGMCIYGGKSIARAQGVSINPQALNFVYQVGGPVPPAQALFLTAAVLTQFSVTVSGAPWLNVTPASGVMPINLTSSVSPPAGVTAGTTLTGSIIIGPIASVDNARIVVPVSLQILSSPTSIVLSPGNLTFDYQTGGAYPPSQAISISSTGSPVNFGVAASTDGGGQWLSVSVVRHTTPSVAYANASFDASAGNVHRPNHVHT